MLTIIRAYAVILLLKGAYNANDSSTSSDRHRFLPRDTDHLAGLPIGRDPEPGRMDPKGQDREQLHGDSTLLGFINGILQRDHKL
jgi:hypothetical protein